MKLKIFGKIIFGIIITCAVIIGGLSVLYVKVLPSVVSNPKIIEQTQKLVKKYTNTDIIIKNPILKTEFSPNIEFSVEQIYLSKEDKKLFELNKFNTAFSLKKILFNEIVIKRLVAKNIYADADGILELIPQKEKQKKTSKNNWNFDIFDALLGVKDCQILYSINPDTKINLYGHRIGVNNAKKTKRNVYFQLISEIYRKDKHVTLKLKDNDKVFFENKHFYIQNCPLSINNSNIFINLTADKKQHFNINLFSKNFNLKDILDFLNTQIIENNIHDTLSYFSNIQGNLDFNLNLKDKNINGNLKINNIKFNVNDLDNILITLTKGNIDLTPAEIKLTDFEGFYDHNSKNKISFAGTVKDYLKTIDTDITGKARVTNDFFKTHLSKMTGSNFEIKGEAPTRITLKSKNNIMDFVWLFMLKQGENIKIGNDYLPFEDSLRLMKADMHLENMILDIKSLDYHMIPPDQILTREEYREKKRKNEEPKPIFKLQSSIDIANNNHIKFVGFEIPEPLPSELLNAVLQQEIFKRGHISGKMSVDNRGKYPFLDGSMSMNKVIIPIQKMYIKQASINAKNNLIHMTSEGRYRRAKFTFDGDILNQIKFPVIIKDVNLSLENLDAVKLLEGFNNQDSLEDVVTTDTDIIAVENSDSEFDIRNIIIEKCRFHLDKGTYKQIEFGNLDADLTLNKDGIIDIKSNNFDFAQGHSNLNSKFDLVNKKYNVKLGVFNVNSDVIASALLDLKKEISGRAVGFLDLNTDDTMKLSGTINFIVTNGTIEKIGLVQYILKCASLLRNTVSMINPAIFSDIVSIPEGKFDKITGELTLHKNVVTRINIKTYANELSNYVAGRYNIDNGDTSLRIYTQFSNVKKGFTGFLRKISLGSLAKRLPMNNKSDVNYYAVELEELPEIEADEKDRQIYLTRVEGDVVNNNYISSLKKIK